MGWNTAQAAAVFARLGIINPIGAACGQPPRRSKFGNVPTVVDGIRFASKAEAQGYRVLKIAESKGLVTELRLQPRYELQAKFTDGQGTKHRAVSYYGDFFFVRDGRQVCVDVKGGTATQTAAFKMKWKMAKAKFPDIDFELWK